MTQPAEPDAGRARLAKANQIRMRAAEDKHAQLLRDRGWQCTPPGEADLEALAAQLRAAGWVVVPPAKPVSERPPEDYVPYGERRPYTVADNLDDLTGPTTGVITLPHHIKWSGTPTSDLDVPGVLMVTYETVLAEASTVADLSQFLNRDKLIELWPVMHLPPKIRRIWEERFPILADTQTKDVV